MAVKRLAIKRGHMEEENVNAIQEVVSPVESEVVSQTTETTSQETDQDKNWRELRFLLKELKKENQELKSQIQSSLHQSPKKMEEDEEEDEPYITPKQFKRKIEELESKYRKKEAEAVIDRLKSKYSDFDDVVSVENVEFLKQNEPALAASLQSLAHDPYQQGLAAYKILKTTDYYMNKQAYKDQNKIIENQKKPMSVNAVRKQGALSEANKFAAGLTPELKKALWQEMQQARKGA